jgi:N-acetylglucosamine kinase-like BadF-type ATPase
MSSFVVGVDGGTTKTIALVADDQGHILGAARGGNSNWTRPDVEIPMRVVADTVQAALVQAGLKGKDIAVGVFGLAGADWPEDYERREAVLSRSGIARQVIVKNDAMVGWRAGTRKTYGVVIAAGTGSNTCVIPPDGQEWCYGYYVFYGGAVDIAQEAIHAVLRQEDGRGEPTVLTQVVLDRLGYATAEFMLKGMVAGRLDQALVHSLCSLVFEAADAGDAVAAEIVVKQGRALAEYATAAIQRFDMQALAFDVVLSGSLFKGQGPLLVDTVTRAIQSVVPRAQITRTQLEPAVGGVLLAYDGLGIDVTDEMYENLKRTTPDPELFSTAEGADTGSAGLDFRQTSTWIGGDGQAEGEE